MPYPTVAKLVSKRQDKVLFIHPSPLFKQKEEVSPRVVLFGLGREVVQALLAALARVSLGCVPPTSLAVSPAQHQDLQGIFVL